MDAPVHDGSESSDGSDSNDRNDLPNVDDDYTNAKTEVHLTTKRDDRGVFMLRLVVQIIVVVAIVITSITYVQLKQSEKNEFLTAVSLLIE